MKAILDYIVARMQEASTWRGLVVLATGLGVHLDGIESDKIIALGLSVAGVIGMFFKDKTPSADPQSVVKK